MRSPLTDPASDILKALGINTDFVLRYSLHFSAEEVTTCMVEVVVCKDPMKSMQEQLKRYKVTLEPLEEETKPKVEPELYFLKDGPKAAGPSLVDGSVFPTGYSRELGA